MVPASMNDRVQAPQAIVIGSSAGAVDALISILPSVPRGVRAAIVVVVHLPASGPNLFPAIMGPRCRVPVVEIEDKMPIAAGTIYFAPSDYHVLFERGLTFSLSCDEPENFSRPSIDVLFESAADLLGAAVTGVVLTGASADGARGLAAIAREGGACIVQLPDGAESPYMPSAARDATPSARVLPLDEIARWLATIPHEAT